MRLLRAADEDEFIPGGDPLVAVLIIEADAQQAFDRGPTLPARGFLGGVAHEVTVGGMPVVSSGFSSVVPAVTAMVVSVASARPSR